MTSADDITLETEIGEEDADRDIAAAVSARQALARKYVLRLRRAHPEATPAEVIQLLERHYATSITTAGALITAGSLAAAVGISLIPGGGVAATGAKAAGAQAAKKVSQEAAKAAAKQAAKVAAKGVALGVAKSGAQRVAGLLPAGEQQLQFEITAIFGLALADIHGMRLDQDQSHALVYGLTNERVSQQQIATMATDIVKATSDAGESHAPVPDRTDWSHWAATLADTLPSGAAQTLVRTVQTGQLETVRKGLSGTQQATIEYGVSALVGGATRFVFGRDVVKASHTAFPPAPERFPEQLELVPTTDEEDGEPNAALAALEDAASKTGAWISSTAGTVGSGVSSSAVAVGTGVASAAGSVTRTFRSVDLDGDGVLDEPQALTAVKGMGGAVAGAATSLGGGVAGFFKSKKRD